MSELNIFEENEKTRFLKSAVIYGANASGKSNLFYGLMFFLKFAATSGPQTQIGDFIKTRPFALSRQTEAAPSAFEIIFYIPNGHEKMIRYRYGFSAGIEKIECEYLFAVNNVREVPLFTRKGQEIEYHTANFKEGARGRSSVRENCTFLSVCAQNNGEISARIIAYFRKIRVLSGLSNQTIIPKEYFDDPAYQKRIIDFLKSADTQIIDMKMERTPVSFGKSPDLKNRIEFRYRNKILFGHTHYDDEQADGQKYFSLNEESAGSRKLFYIRVLFLRPWKTGCPSKTFQFTAYKSKKRPACYFLPCGQYFDQ
jgi:AAA15 family ATPase/GTPase